MAAGSRKWCLRMVVTSTVSWYASAGLGGSACTAHEAALGTLGAEARVPRPVGGLPIQSRRGSGALEDPSAVTQDSCSGAEPASDSARTWAHSSVDSRRDGGWGVAWLNQRWCERTRGGPAPGDFELIRPREAGVAAARSKQNDATEDRVETMSTLGFRQLQDHSRQVTVRTP